MSDSVSRAAAGQAKASGENATSDGSTDGREQRSQRSREAIVEAMLQLVGDGNLRPTAEQVAAQAGVGIRTVFRHFSDTEGLFRAMNAHIAAEARPLLSGGDKAGPLPVRCEALSQQRALFYERIGPYRRAGELLAWRSDFVRESQRVLARELRQNLLEWLPELGSADQSIQDAAEMITSFEAWNRLRTEQRSSNRRAAAAICVGLTALLARADSR